MYSPVLIVGGGPIGSLLAISLSRFNQPCILIERSLTPTRWPKMEQMNARTMEVIRFLGIADRLKAVRGIPRADSRWNVKHATGLGDVDPVFAEQVSCLAKLFTCGNILGYTPPVHRRSNAQPKLK
jgi:FAD-dependent monooxygenase